MIRILNEAKNSLLNQYQTLFDLDGVQLEFEESALEAIADKALSRKTGARGLRSIMESATLDLMYHIPSEDDITKCIITKDVIAGNAEPFVVRNGERLEYKGRVS